MPVLLDLYCQTWAGQTGRQGDKGRHSPALNHASNSKWRRLAIINHRHQPNLRLRLLLAPWPRLPAWKRHLACVNGDEERIRRTGQRGEWMEVRWGGDGGEALYIFGITFLAS